MDVTAEGTDPTCRHIDDDLVSPYSIQHVCQACHKT